jgi:hypothetical protein
MFDRGLQQPGDTELNMGRALADLDTVSPTA